jgi:hypothetical protein
MCKKSGETIDHLLLLYDFARALWNSVFCLCELEWVMLRRVVDLFASWRGQFGSFRSAAVWKMIPPWLMWCIWRERNARSFEDWKSTVVEPYGFFFKTLYQQTAAYDCIIISNFS